LTAAAAFALVLAVSSATGAQAPASPASGSAAGQMPVQIAPLAEEHLRAAIDALNGIDASSFKGESATRFAAVKRDFHQMREALSRPSASTNGDWRSAYSAVERDLTPLIGPMNGAAATAGAPATATGLDSVTVGGLELFRSSLELFYTSMMGDRMPAPAATPSQGAAASQGAAPVQGPAPQAPIPAPPAAPAQAVTAAQPKPQPQSAFDASGAGALLDRIEMVVSAALGKSVPSTSDKPIGTTGALPGVDKKSPAGRVTVDRAALDEVLAEVQQLKIMLRIRQ
jgi:hypothetical protein